MESWADIACRAAGRNMTRSEWELFGPKDTAYRATCPEFPLIKVTATPATAETTVNPTTGPTTITETAALAIVESAFAAYNSGDMDTWILWREGGRGSGADAAYQLAAGSRLNVEQCTYRGYGVWQAGSPMTGHGFDCAVTGTDRILEAAGIELEMTYNWIIGESPGWSIGGSNEDYRFVKAFMAEYRAWLETTHPDVAATIQTVDFPELLPPESVPTALEYIDDFVAQSDVYPLTEPVPEDPWSGGPLERATLLYVPLHDG